MCKRNIIFTIAKADDGSILDALSSNIQHASFQQFHGHAFIDSKLVPYYYIPNLMPALG